MAKNKYIISVAKPYKTTYPSGTALKIESTQTVVKEGETDQGNGYNYAFYNPKITVITPTEIIDIIPL